VESHADIATSLLARAPSIAATSVRGMLALRMKLRHRPRTTSERESVHRARLSERTRVAAKVQTPDIAAAIAEVRASEQR
jgi:hypothetical protein